MKKLSTLDAIGTGVVLGALLVDVLADKKKCKQHEEKVITKKVIEKDKNGIKIRHEVYNDGYTVTTTISPDGFTSERKYNSKKHIDYSYNDSTGVEIKYFPNGRDKEHIFQDGSKFVYNESGNLTYKELPDGSAYVYDADGLLIRTISKDTK